jgi:hypothetical protein
MLLLAAFVSSQYGVINEPEGKHMRVPEHTETSHKLDSQ